MSFGLRILANDKGAVIDTSKSVSGFALVDAFRVSSGESGSRSYPELAGFTVYTNEVAEASISYNSQYAGVHTVSVSYSGGIPVVSYSPVGRAAPATRIYVFAR